MTTEPLSQEAVTEYRQRYLELDEQRAEIVAEQESIKAAIAEAGVGYSHTYDDGGKVAVSVNHRFDADLAQRIIGLEIAAGRVKSADVAACWSNPQPVLSSTKVKAILPPATYEQCMKDAGRPRVTIS